MKTQYQQFADWLQTPLGQAVLKNEQKGLKPFWKIVAGDSLVTLTTPVQACLAKEYTGNQKVVVSPDIPLIGTHITDSIGNDSLSLLPDSIDVILLPHILEFAEDPYQVLRESDLILRPDGYMIIVGFNPVSSWGLRKLFSFKQAVPWSGVFRWSHRIKDWLKLLNFEVIRCDHFFYRPPVANEKIFSCLKFLEYLGKYLFPFLGGIYIVVARKKTFYVKPLRSRWRKIAKVLANEKLEPATRKVGHE